MNCAELVIVSLKFVRLVTLDRRQTLQSDNSHTWS